MSQSWEEEEDSELFYESLDRILSTPSIPSSDEENDLNSPNYASEDTLIPKFPMSISTYDIWISEPSSIEERRKRLLHEMGLITQYPKSNLSADSAKESCSDRDPEFGRSDDSSTIDRFNSFSSRHCNFSVSSPTINSIQLVSAEIETHPLLNNLNVASSLNKPPSGRCDRSTNMNMNMNTNPNSNSSLVMVNPIGGEFDEDLNCNGVVSLDPDRFCTIKNLDNGKEFVVNEFGEDGMWNKLREVGTDRQLTMEEFEMCVGRSPIVHELMRRQNVAEQLNFKKDEMGSNGSGSNGVGVKSKKGSWFKNIKNVANTVTGYRDRRSSDERDTSSEKGGRRSSSATDDSHDVSFNGHERVRVRQYRKSCKELTALYKSQEIQAHNGPIWSIKFSLDGRYLASAGEDRVIHIWQVVESERKGDLLMEKQEHGNSNLYFAANESPELMMFSPNVVKLKEKKRRGRASIGHKSISLDHIMVPESVFALSEKPFCSFRGHLHDVLDLSWSKSQYLLSSSMDKTVRMWHMGSNSCLKIFSHSDYVTCIQFNPVDDRYFISGSLDAKVRIWSIPDRQVVDWNDLHEMVTAACYTPDGQGALVGSYKGNCCLYDTSENQIAD